MVWTKGQEVFSVFTTAFYSVTKFSYLCTQGSLKDRCITVLHACKGRAVMNSFLRCGLRVQGVGLHA